MNNHREPPSMSKLQEALSAAKRARMELQTRQEEKRWADIPFPLRLEDALNRLSKEELSGLRQRLNIKNASHLRKRELIAELGRMVPDAVERLWPLLDQERFNLLQKISAGGGWLPSPDLEDDRLDYWKTRGVVFTGTVRGIRMLVMPQEIAESFGRIDGRALAPILHRNTEWILLAQGMLYYYGTLSFHDLESLLEKYTGQQAKTGDYFEVFAEAMDYYREMRLDHNGYSNCRVWDSDQVKREQGARLGVGFYPFTAKQLRNAGVPGFVDRSPAYGEFAAFLANRFEMNRKQADLLVQECEFAARMGESPASIVQFLASQIELEGEALVSDLLSRLTRLYNETRQWFLKGHKPLELLKAEKKLLMPLPVSNQADVIDISTRKKIGRNDPCPCGSGKKFKKCCGG